LGSPRTTETTSWTLLPALLRTRVARRVLVLFVACALVPLVALAGLAYQRVGDELESLGRNSLRRAAKDYGMSLAERLRLREAQLSLLVLLPEGSVALADDLDGPFRRVSLWRHDTVEALLGEAIGRELLQHDDARSRLRDGQSVVLPMSTGSGRVLVLAVPSRDGSRVAVGELDSETLWSLAYSLDVGVETVVLDSSYQPLVASIFKANGTPATISPNAFAASTGSVDWELESEAWIGSYWTLPLFEFGLSGWNIVMTRSAADILAPVADFNRVFGRVLLLSLWLVLLLSIAQIRRTMEPLGELSRVTKQIAAQDFSARAEVRSNDEFGELAVSFNEMAQHLSRQFRMITTIADIDRAVLASLDVRDIARTVTEYAAGTTGVRVAAMILLEEDETRIYATDGHGRLDSDVGPAIPAADVERLVAASGCLSMRLDPESRRLYFGRLADASCQTALMQSVVVNGELAAVLTLAGDGDSFGADITANIQQLSAQVAVALANTRLVEDLDAANRGTLRALGRAIDAKSQWTAGHSDRVADLAVRLARYVGHDAAMVDIIFRGSLVHDVGKIGIPGAILDKTGRLDPHEVELMQQHPTLGAQILEPIPAYEPLIPVVLQHHERHDGHGYPNGVSGAAFRPEARIVAVADAYDAMTSDRPYREGLSITTALGEIREGAGTHFDPDLAAAFLEMPENAVALLRDESAA